jgi:hypothetical protein
VSEVPLQTLSRDLSMQLEPRSPMPRIQRLAKPIKFSERLPISLLIQIVRMRQFEILV